MRQTSKLGMKLIPDVTLLFLLAVDNGIFVFFFMSQVWTMKLNESMNICYVSLGFLVQLK